MIKFSVSKINCLRHCYSQEMGLPHHHLYISRQHHCLQSYTLLDPLCYSLSSEPSAATAIPTFLKLRITIALSALTCSQACPTHFVKSILLSLALICPFTYASKLFFMCSVDSCSIAALKGLLKQTSNGWTRLVQPPLKKMY